MWATAFATAFALAGAEAFVLPQGCGRSTFAHNWVKTRSAPRRELVQWTAESSSLDSGSVDIRDKLREAIWSATDAIGDAVEEASKEASASTSDESPLASLGKALMELDDKYFGKYVATTPTSQYLGTLSPPAAAEAPTAKDGTKSPSKAAAVIQDAAKGLVGAESSAAVAVSEVSTKASEGGPAGSSASVKKQAAQQQQGTVDLQRPDKVQNVFDELQKAAVSLYKDTVGGGAGSKEVAVPTSSRALLESKLDALLEANAYSPAAMPAAQKQQLVDAVMALEASYPAGSAPLSDPALSGQWSLVYSSKANVFKAMLGGKRARLFRVSSPMQSVDTSKTTVTNSCDLRLRFTPLKIPMTQTGTYRRLGSTEVEVTFQRGRLSRWLSPFRRGMVKAGVTYVSDKWRICRSDGCLLAFRKVKTEEEKP